MLMRRACPVTLSLAVCMLWMAGCGSGPSIIHARNIHVFPDSLSYTDRWSNEMAFGRWTSERASGRWIGTSASVPMADVKAVKAHTAGGVLKSLLYRKGFSLALSIAVPETIRGCLRHPS